MAELIITYPDGRTERQPLVLKPQDLGREPICDICINDASTSRRHAEIRGDSHGAFVIRDLGSKNGTLVNNLSITSQTLNHGDEIVLGSVVARFQAVDAPPSESIITLEDQPTNLPEAISHAGHQKQLRLSQQRLQILYDISARLTGLRDRQALLDDIMRICIETFEFERSAIAIKRPNSRAVDWPVVHNLRQADGEIKLSRTILKQALEDGERVVFSDTMQPLADLAQSIVQQGMRSAMCVPIAYSDEILGVIYGDRITTTRQYGQEDVDFLAALARQLSIGLTNSRLLEKQQRQTQLESEIKIARQIQSGLFPETLDLHAGIEIAALNDPGRQVSGDFYDVVPMNDGRIGFIIADVSGKGVAASLLSANLQAAVRVLLPETSDLALLARRLNKLVYDNTDPSRFITSLLVAIDVDKQQLELVSAGHHFPIQVSVDSCQILSSKNTHLPFGIAKDAEYNNHIFDLKSGPYTLLLYTDGLNEALDEQENQFGTEGIIQLLSCNTESTPLDLLKEIRQSVAEFCGNVPQSDDITLLAVKALKQPDCGAQITD